MRFPKFPAVLAAALIAASPAWAETVKGSGNLRSEARTATGFTGVAVAVPAKVEVRIGATESVTIEADDNILPLIETSVSKGSLVIRPVRRNLSFEAKSIKVVVQARQVEELEISGTGSIQADSIRGPKLKLGIAGAGSMDLSKLDTGKLDVSVAGSGDVKLTGSARQLDANIAGSGDIDAPAFVVDDADIDIAGSGAAQLGVRKTLDVSVAGSGAVRYFGDPEVKRTVLGAGTIRRGGPLPQ